MSYKSIIGDENINILKKELLNAQTVFERNGYNKDSSLSLEKILKKCETLVKGNNSEFSKKLQRDIEQLSIENKANINNKKIIAGKGNEISKQLKQISENITIQSEKQDETEILNKKIIEGLIRKIGKAVTSANITNNINEAKNNTKKDKIISIKKLSIGESGTEIIKLNNDIKMKAKIANNPDKAKVSVAAICGDGGYTEGLYSSFGKLVKRGSEEIRCIATEVGRDEQRGVDILQKNIYKPLRENFIEWGNQLKGVQQDIPAVLFGHSSGTLPEIGAFIGTKDELEEISDLSNAYDLIVVSSMNEWFCRATYYDLERSNKRGEEKTLYVPVEKFVFTIEKDTSGRLNKKFPNENNMQALFMGDYTKTLSGDKIESIKYFDDEKEALEALSDNENSLIVLYTRAGHGDVPEYIVYGDINHSANSSNDSVGFVKAFGEAYQAKYENPTYVTTTIETKQTANKDIKKTTIDKINLESTILTSPKHNKETQKEVDLTEQIKEIANTGTTKKATARIESKDTINVDPKQDETLQNNTIQEVPDLTIQVEQIAASSIKTERTAKIKPDNVVISQPKQETAKIQKQEQAKQTEKTEKAKKTEKTENTKESKKTKEQIKQHHTSTTIMPAVKNSNSIENQKLAKEFGYNMVGDVGDSAKIGYKKGSGNTKTLDIIIPSLDNLTDFIQKYDMKNYTGANDILVVQFNDQKSLENSNDVFKDIYNAIVSYVKKGYTINIQGANDSEEIVNKLKALINQNKNA